MKFNRKKGEKYGKKIMELLVIERKLIAVFFVVLAVIENSDNYYKNSHNSLMDNSEKPILINRIIHININILGLLLINLSYIFFMINLFSNNKENLVNYVTSCTKFSNGQLGKTRSSINLIVHNINIYTEHTGLLDNCSEVIR